MKSLLDGRLWLQPLFEKLHTLSLSGMNFGNFDGERNGERALLKKLKKSAEASLAQKPYVIFDVGANYGQYTQCVDQVFGKSAYVYAFEPSVKAFESLTHLQQTLGKFETHNEGFHHQAQDAKLHAVKDGSSGASVFENPRESLESCLDVKLETLDGFCKTQGITHIDLLKIDTEGNELNVLLGAQDMLNAKAISHIQFEFGEKMIFSKTSFWDLWRFFQKHDYQVGRIVKDGVRPIVRYSPNLEIVTGANFFSSVTCLRIKNT